MPSGEKSINWHHCGNNLQCIKGKRLFDCWFVHLAGLQVTVTGHLFSMLKTNIGSHKVFCSQGCRSVPKLHIRTEDTWS